MTDIELPAWLEGTLAGLLIAGALTMLYRYARSVQKQQDNQLTLDDRVIRQLDERDDTIRELRSEAKELQVNLTKLTGEIVQLAKAHSTEMMTAIEHVRQKYDDGMARAYQKIEETERRLGAAEESVRQCTESHSRCEERVSQLERKLTSHTG